MKFYNYKIEIQTVLVICFAQHKTMLMTSMMLTWPHICPTIFTLNDNVHI